jgi:hypothetical protein
MLSSTVAIFDIAREYLCHPSLRRMKLPVYGMATGKVVTGGPQAQYVGAISKQFDRVPKVHVLEACSSVCLCWERSQSN